MIKFFYSLSNFFPNFPGESSDPDGIIGVLEFRDVDGTEKVYMNFFKHGLEEEKV